MAKTLLDLGLQTQDGTLTNAKIASAAGIPYSKLTLTGAVLNADLSGSIAYSKLTLTGAVLNADLAGSIAYGKLSLTGAVLNADLAGSIAFSKLASITAGFIPVGPSGNGSPVAVAMSGDITIGDTGVTAIGATKVTNAMLAGSIAYAKLSLTGAILNADLDGSIATAKLVDGASFVQSDGSVSMAAALAMGTNKITGLTDGSAATDAATKGQLDAVVSGLDPKASCKMASTADIPGTYANTGGSSARGQFTAMANASIDGVALVNGDRILLKDQTGSGAENGIWVITTVGTGSDGVWDRAEDFDEDSEVTAGAYTFVSEGTDNADAGYVLTTNDPIVIGGASGTVLAFTQFSGAGQITAGTGLAKSGNTINAGDAGKGIQVNADDFEFSASEAVASAGGLEAGSNSWELQINLEASSPSLQISATELGLKMVSADLTKGASGVGLSNTAATPGSFGSVTESAIITVDAKGRITSSSESSIQLASSAAVTGLDTALGLKADESLWSGKGVIIGASAANTPLALAAGTNDYILTADSAAGAGIKWSAAASTWTFVVRETPSGLVNGSNTTYTLSNTPESGTEEIYLNGLQQESGGGNDYTISGLTITYLTAPLTGDKIRVSYRY